MLKLIYGYYKTEKTNTTMMFLGASSNCGKRKTKLWNEVSKDNPATIKTKLFQTIIISRCKIQGWGKFDEEKDMCVVPKCLPTDYLVKRGKE